MSVWRKERWRERGEREREKFEEKIKIVGCFLRCPHCGAAWG